MAEVKEHAQVRQMLSTTCGCKMNARQRRKARRRYDGRLLGVRVRMARFKRRMCGAVQIPIRYVFPGCDNKGFIKEQDAKR